MIKADFYETRYTATAGKYTDSAFTLANSGDYTPENFANPYMMGYIPAEEVPLPLILSNWYVDGEGEDAVIHFRRANNETMLWGLSMAYGSNGSSWDGDHFFYSSNNATWTRAENFSLFKPSYFINEAEVINYQNSGYYGIEYVSVKHNQDDTWSDSTVNLNLSIYKNAEEIRKFIAGEENWTLQIAGHNTVDVNYSMVNEYGMLEYDGGNYTIYFCFYGIVQQGGASSCAVSVASGRGTSMIPFFKFSATNTNTQDATTCFTASNAPGHFSSFGYNTSSHTVYSSIHPVFNGMFLGITDSDLPVSEIPGRGESKVYNQFFMYWTSIYSAIPLTEAYKYICIPNKFYKNATSFGNVPASASYNEDYTVALFNKSNKPLWTRATGSFASLLPKLQTWQYPGTDISENDFDPGNIPPTPGGDDDPGSDDPVETPLITGDDQQLQPNRTLGAPLEFITPYLITPPILSIFGRTLWTSLANYDPQDPTTVDVFKNFFAILNEEVTGSLDIGSILSFIVSVRQYPFNVASLNIIQSAGNTISFGTGKVPIDCGSAAVVYKLTSTIGLLDCGSLNIADYKDFKLYNDFRDYLNASVSAYLPYCGTVELNPVEVIHNTLHCYYAIDFYTGECTAYITCTDGNHEWISAIKNGIIGVLLPITATNSGQVSARHLSDNAKDSSLIASAVGSMFGAIGNIATGNVMGAASNITGLAQIGASQQMLQAERQGRSAVMSPSLSGGSGAAAFFQPSCASVLVRRGTYARHKISNYPQSCGYPSTTSGTLSSFSGYTECYNVDVDGINCTEEERAAIKTILETGVYL